MSDATQTEPEKDGGTDSRAAPPVMLGPESFSEFRLGPLLVLYQLARDPNDRLWGHTEPSGQTRTRHVWSLHWLEVPEGRKLWGAYIGPLCLYWRFSG